MKLEDTETVLQEAMFILVLPPLALPEETPPVMNALPNEMI